MKKYRLIQHIATFTLICLLSMSCSEEYAESYKETIKSLSSGYWLYDNNDYPKLKRFYKDGAIATYECKYSATKEQYYACEMPDQEDIHYILDVENQLMAIIPENKFFFIYKLSESRLILAHTEYEGKNVILFDKIKNRKVTIVTKEQFDKLPF